MDDSTITGSRVTGLDAGTVREVRARVATHLVGRERETDLLLAAVAAGRDVLLEGPPGTSKSTLLRSITEDLEAGHAAVIQIVSTGEALMERR